MGKAEEDQHVFSAEIAVSDRLAVLVDEGEGTADQSRASRLDLWSLRAAGEDQRTSASERANEKSGKDHDEQAAAHLIFVACFWGRDPAIVFHMPKTKNHSRRGSGNRCSR